MPTALAPLPEELCHPQAGARELLSFLADEARKNGQKLEVVWEPDHHRWRIDNPVSLAGYDLSGFNWQATREVYFKKDLDLGEQPLTVTEHLHVGGTLSTGAVALTEGVSALALKAPELEVTGRQLVGRKIDVSHTLEVKTVDTRDLKALDFPQLRQLDADGKREAVHPYTTGGLPEERLKAQEIILEGMPFITPTKHMEAKRIDLRMASGELRLREGTHIEAEHLELSGMKKITMEQDTHIAARTLAMANVQQVDLHPRAQVEAKEVDLRHSVITIENPEQVSLLEAKAEESIITITSPQELEAANTAKSPHQPEPYYKAAISGDFHNATMKIEKGEVTFSGEVDLRGATLEFGPHVSIRVEPGTTFRVDKYTRLHGTAKELLFYFTKENRNQLAGTQEEQAAEKPVAAAVATGLAMAAGAAAGYAIGAALHDAVTSPAASPASPMNFRDRGEDDDGIDLSETDTPPDTPPPAPDMETPARQAPRHKQPSQEQPQPVAQTAAPSADGQDFRQRPAASGTESPAPEPDHPQAAEERTDTALTEEEIDSLAEEIAAAYRQQLEQTEPPAPEQTPEETRDAEETSTRTRPSPHPSA